MIITTTSDLVKLHGRGRSPQDGTQHQLGSAAMSVSYRTLKSHQCYSEIFLRALEFLLIFMLHAIINPKRL